MGSCSMALSFPICKMRGLDPDASWRFFLLVNHGKSKAMPKISANFQSGGNWWGGGSCS